jgi:hypothetical protein
MEEIWKCINGYEDKYQVSNIGNVRSMHFNNKKLLHIKDNGVRNLKLIKNSYGYYVVSLCGKQIFVHRIVAETFIPNPDNKPVVDHINTIKTDNRISNLKWATIYENVNNPLSSEKRNFSIKNKLKGKYGEESNKHRNVFQYSLNGEFIKEWGCMSDACRFYKINNGAMTHVCKLDQNQIGGFIWRYFKYSVTPVSPRIKRIRQYDKNNNFIREWDRITDAAEFYNISTGRICTCLKGHTATCMGYKWEYL